MRKDGIMLFANCSNLASSMPLSWNRGIGPLYFNQVEGIRCDETNVGVTVLDERTDPGGQFYKPLAASHAAARPPARWTRPSPRWAWRSARSCATRTVRRFRRR